MDIIGTASLLFGAGGLVVGVYSYYKQSQFEEEVEERQKKYEKQLDRKQDLRELSSQLEDTVSTLNWVKDGLQEPTTEVDLWNQLKGLAKEVVVYKHMVGGCPQIITKVGGEDQKYDNPQQILNEFKQNYNWVSISIRIDDSTTGKYNIDYSFSLDEAIFRLFMFYKNVNKLNEKHLELIEEFEPELLEELESHVSNIIYSVYENAMGKSNEVVIDPDEFDTTEEVGIEIFDQFVAYDGLDDDLNKFDDLVRRVENLRTNLLQTSYS